MKDFDAAMRDGKFHLESFPGSKPIQLNHHIKPALQEYSYDSVIIHVGINDILSCKNYAELKKTTKLYNENSAYMSKIKYFKNIYPIYLIVSCTRTFAKIAKINEGIKN